MIPELNQILHADCKDIMKNIPDKYFDLAIIDPPYGIERFKNAQPTRLNKYGNVGIVNDIKPDKNYFIELFRISKNQIVWGFNHLCDLLPPTKEYIFWYKHQPVVTFGDGELAWTSFNKTSKCFDFPYFGSKGSDLIRIHPTQKPVALYRWILSQYAKPGDKIIDTHSGSGSCAIACHLEKFDFLAIEKDEDYYNASVRRLEEIRQQGVLF